MRLVHGVVQHYAWGDTVAIPRVLGIEPDGRPWAELWLGTHPGAPSTVDDGRPLRETSGDLPYLLKLLAAAEPLSLQTHPDTATAAGGFARENELGIALDDPRRVYRDPDAKPELLCALTPFDALSGFRPVEASVALLHDLGAHDLAHHLATHGLAATVADLYEHRFPTAATIDACRVLGSPEAQLVATLDRQYPGEPSVVVTLLLHRVSLQPGEAIFLGPGNLHAYLHGLGVEVMGASDNVVRGGLTVKHVDVPELLRVLRYEPLPDPVVRAAERSPGCWCYPTPDAPFELWRYEVASTCHHIAETRELLICTAGDAGALHQGEAGYLEPGEATALRGTSTVFRVTSH
jgi:mannose-6-phosphate isomerase